MKSLENSLIQIGAWRVNAALDEISRDGETTKLEPKMMKLLLCLAAHASQVVSVEQLLDEVWKDVVVTPDSVYHAVAALRRVLGDDSKDPSYIANVMRRGYRLIAPVVPLGEAGAPAPILASPRSAAEAQAVKPAGEVPQNQIIRKLTGHRLGIALITVLAVALAYFVVDRFWIAQRSRATQAGAPVAQTVSTASTTVAALTPPPHSIAVLPFVDMSEKHDQEYFADGLSEELIDMLTKVSDLRVPARTSSFFFKGKSEDIATIAQKLRVAHVLEGSVRKAGNTIRVTTELIRADNGYHIWSETYDRDLKDVFKVQDEIASAVVSALKVKLAPGQQMFSSHRTSNPEAYNQYLLGRQFFEGGTDDRVRRSVKAFRKAIELDPHYASAYAMLARSEFFVADDTADMVGKEQALAMAEKAVELAPDEADGYATRGYLRLTVRWDWTGAQADFGKALAIDSGNPWSQMGYSQLLRTFGRFSEAIAAAKKAAELDPLSNVAWENLGLNFVENRQYAAAHEALRRALEIEPEATAALGFLGEVQLLEGNAIEARATFRSVENSEGLRPWGLAMAEHTLGHSKESQQALNELIAKHAPGYDYEIANVYAWRGEKDKAFEWLELSYQRRESDLVYIKDDPLLDPVRSDPRFGAMLRKMNLPD